MLYARQGYIDAVRVCGEGTVVRGRLSDTSPDQTYLADGITFPMRFGQGAKDVLLTPIISFHAPDPLKVFLQELIRSMAMNGQLTDKEYAIMMKESITPDTRAPALEYVPGRHQRIGTLHLQQSIQYTDTLKCFLESAIALDKNHPRFEVTSDMLQKHERWPEELKRDYVLK